jgi:hypothetical protein
MPTRKSMRPLPYTLPMILAAGLAHAQSRHLEATGTSLTISGSCAREVTIEPDAGLSGRAVVDAVAEHPEETAQLVFESGNTAKLRITGEECWRPGGAWTGSPTMKIAVRVPPSFGIAIDEGGGVRYRVGAVGGPLSLDLSGGVILTAVKATALDADISGGGEATVTTVDGPAKASISGGGTITVTHGQISGLHLDISGGGGFSLGDGAVSALALDMSGGGQAHIGATVGTAALDVSGGGTVEIAKVTGPVTKDVDESATVDIGQ